MIDKLPWLFLLCAIVGACLLIWRKRIRQWFSGRPKPVPVIAAYDKLPWREKAPLALALLAQSYVVFLWYWRSTQGIHPWADFAVAVAAGAALDWLTVSTVMGRREGRTSAWSWATSVGAFVGSALIAYDTYAIQTLDARALLHIVFPLVVLLYSLHLASPQRLVAPLALARQQTFPTPEPVRTDQVASNSANTEPQADRTCRHCGASGLTQVDLMAHGRAYKKHGACP